MQTAKIEFDRSQIDDAITLKPYRGDFSEDCYHPTRRQPKGNHAVLRMNQILILKGNQEENGPDTWFRLESGGLVRWVQDADYVAAGYEL